MFSMSTIVYSLGYYRSVTLNEGFKKNWTVFLIGTMCKLISSNTKLFLWFYFINDIFRGT